MAIVSVTLLLSCADKKKSGGYHSRAVMTGEELAKWNERQLKVRQMDSLKNILCREKIISEDTVPYGFHRYVEHEWVTEDGTFMYDEDTVPWEYIMTSADRMILRDKLTDKRDSLVDLDRASEVLSNCMYLTIVLADLQWNFDYENPAVITPMVGYNHKIDRIKYFLKTSPCWPDGKYEKPYMFAVMYCLSFKNNEQYYEKGMANKRP